MRTKVAKWGNSLAVRIPAALAEDLPVADGDTVELTAENGALVVRPSQPELRIEDIVHLITDENMHEYIDFGCPVGKELI